MKTFFFPEINILLLNSRTNNNSYYFKFLIHQFNNFQTLIIICIINFPLFFSFLNLQRMEKNVQSKSIDLFYTIRERLINLEENPSCNVCLLTHDRIIFWSVNVDRWTRLKNGRHGEIRQTFHIIL